MLLDIDAVPFDVLDMLSIPEQRVGERYTDRQYSTTDADWCDSYSMTPEYLQRRYVSRTGSTCDYAGREYLQRWEEWRYANFLEEMVRWNS